MDFRDLALVRFAGPQTRRTLLDDLALEHILAAGFEADALGVEGPYDATFDDVQATPATSARVSIEGGWSSIGGPDRTDARFDLPWQLVATLPRPDAPWVGTVVARAAVGGSTLASVRAAWPDLAGLDSDVNPRPTDPAELEAARRAVLKTRLATTAADPDAVDDRLVDRLLSSAGVDSVGDLALAHRSGRATGGLRVAYAPSTDPDPPPTTPRAFPVAVALMTRDSEFSLTSALAEARLHQSLLRDSLTRPPDRALLPRHPIVVAVVVPATTFDDPGWPGAAESVDQATARLQRRTAAAGWLADAGVVLVPFDPP